MDIIHQIYHKSTSRRSFYTNLEKAGLKLIRKNERVTGFRDAGGRKFSFTKIGITEQSMLALDAKQELKLLRIQERLQRLEDRERLRGKNKEQDIKPKR